MLSGLPERAVSMARTTRLGWYRRRVAGMSPAEVAWRVRDEALRSGQGESSSFCRTLPSVSAGLPPCCGRRRPRVCQRRPRNAVLEAASGLLRGEWEVLDVAARTTQAREISRLQHLTLLATAWFLTQEQAYATTGRRSAAFLVAGEPLPVRCEPGERHRARHPPDQPGLDPPSAGRLARRCRSVRARRARGASDPLASALSRRVPQPRLRCQGNGDRRGCRTVRGQLRVPVVPRERALAAEVGAAPRA